MAVKNYFEFAGSKENLEKLMSSWEKVFKKDEDLINQNEQCYADNGNLCLYIDHEFDLVYELYVKEFVKIAKANNVSFHCVFFDTKELDGDFAVAVFRHTDKEPQYFGFTSAVRSNIKVKNNVFTYSKSQASFETFQDLLLHVAKQEYGEELFDLHKNNLSKDENLEVKECKKLDSGFFILSLSNGAQLIVDKYDFETSRATFSLDEAIDAVKDRYEHPWRLPTRKELKWIAENIYKQGKGYFLKKAYWSSDFRAADGGYTYVFGFGFDRARRTAKCKVRLVLDVDEKMKSNLDGNLKKRKENNVKQVSKVEIINNGNFVIEKNSKGQKLEVAEHDFPNKMNWFDAIEACEKLGDGWRLPTKNELKQMFIQLHQKGLGNFKDKCYLSSSVTPSDNASFYYFGGEGYTGSNYKQFDEYVRAVRDVKKK